jgi:hypothetical protein
MIAGPPATSVDPAAVIEGLAATIAESAVASDEAPLVVIEAAPETPAECVGAGEELALIIE